MFPKISNLLNKAKSARISSNYPSITEHLRTINYKIDLTQTEVFERNGTHWLKFPINNIGIIDPQPQLWKLKMNSDCNFTIIDGNSDIFIFNLNYFPTPNIVIYRHISGHNVKK